MAGVSGEYAEFARQMLHSLSTLERRVEGLERRLEAVEHALARAATALGGPSRPEAPASPSGR